MPVSMPLLMEMMEQYIRHFLGIIVGGIVLLVKMEAVSFLIHRRAHLQTAIFYAGL